MDERHTGGGSTGYPMRVVTRLTGLSAHAIRVWERRYGAVVPARTAGNGRRYGPEEVRRLTLLRQLTEAGMSIKDIAARGEAELRVLLERHGRERAATSTGLADDGYAHVRHDYLEAIRRFDVRVAGELLARAAVSLPRSEFVFHVVLPIMRTTGDWWERGTFSVAHEHQVTAQVRGLLDTLLRQTSAPRRAARLLAATPEGHLHEFGALVGALLAASNDWEALYLGPSVPFADLARAAVTAQPRVVLLSVVRDVAPDELDSLRAGLALVASVCPVWLGVPAGHVLESVAPPVRVFGRFEDLELALQERAP